MTKDKLATLLVEARATNDYRDALERKAGFGTPGSGTDAMWARTIITSLEAGLAGDDPTAIAEGLVMLVDLEHRLRMKDPLAKENAEVPLRKYEPWKYAAPGKKDP